MVTSDGGLSALMGTYARPPLATAGMYESQPQPQPQRGRAAVMITRMTLPVRGGNAGQCPLPQGIPGSGIGRTPGLVPSAGRPAVAGLVIVSATLPSNLRIVAVATRCSTT